MSTTIDEVRRVALSLPEATEEPHFHFTSFRVGGKIFATAPPGGALLHVFVDEAEREVAIAASPESCQALHWGKKLVGVRVELAKASRRQVEGMLRSAYARKAPKRLSG